MELKVEGFCIIISTVHSLNCTFMELKEKEGMEWHGATGGLNCTFMELKADIRHRRRGKFLGLNCTFMELKERRSTEPVE